jgi:ketosteroid isomerase-like protein
MVMSTQDKVHETSKRFYEALNRLLDGDASFLTDVWSHNEAATTMHPVGGRQVGWDEVRQSWEQIAPLASGGRVKLDDQIIQVVGDVAYELGVERGHMELAGERIPVDQRVTNIYRREADQWKIVLHHTDVSSAMQDVLGRIQAGERTASSAHV